MEDDLNEVDTPNSGIFQDLFPCNVSAVMERAVNYVRAQATQERPSSVEATNVEDEIFLSLQKIANHAKTLKLFQVSIVEHVAHELLMQDCTMNNSGNFWNQNIHNFKFSM